MASLSASLTIEELPRKGAAPLLAVASYCDGRLQQASILDPEVAAQQLRTQGNPDGGAGWLRSSRS